MNSSKLIKIKRNTDNLLKTEFPDLKMGKITYDDIIKSMFIIRRKKRK